MATLLFTLAGCVPSGYSMVHVLGFLEELVVNNDPEYKVPSSLIVAHVLQSGCVLLSGLIRYARREHQMRQGRDCSLSCQLNCRGRWVLRLLLLVAMQ